MGATASDAGAPVHLLVRKLLLRGCRVWSVLQYDPTPIFDADANQNSPGDTLIRRLVLVGILVLLWGRMAAAVITADATSTTTGNGTRTWAHTKGSGTNGAIVVMTAHWKNGGVVVTGVTYNAVALTLVAEKDGDPAVSVVYELHGSSYDAIAAGAHDVVVTITGGNEVAAGASSWFGVSSFRTPATASGSDFLPTVTVTGGATGDVVVDAVATLCSGAALSPGAGQSTVLSQLNCNAGLYSSQEAGAASVVMSWTGYNADGRWATIGVAMAPVATTPCVTPCATPLICCQDNDGNGTCD